MEGLKTIPVYKRFGFKVLLFNVLLLLSIIAPTLMIRNMDYKHLVDRISFQANLFDYYVDELESLDPRLWPGTMEALPKLFYQQRICVFKIDKELIYDSGATRTLGWEYAIEPLLPIPYVDWTKQKTPLDPDVYIEHLRNIDISKLDQDTVFHSTRTVRYPEGLDRIVLFGKLVHASDGESFIFTMSQSVVDILIYGRSIKERFLFIYSFVILLSLLLTIVLSRSVTIPLKRLHAYSREILASRMEEDDSRKLPSRGEIGEICQALQRLIGEQKRQSNSFMHFSSDVVHELRTPLAAIRSGLEMYGESTDEKEKEEMYTRINRRIRQMDDLMDEIRFIGSVESGNHNERCTGILPLIEEILYEFKDADIRFGYGSGIDALSLPISFEKAYRIMANLLRNAVSFSPDVGSVTLSLAIVDDHLVITVRDQGPGISEEIFPRITQRFFTFRPKNDGKHSGLGLSIVDAILRSCGGTLEYRNRVEGGAEFTCKIPVAP